MLKLKGNSEISLHTLSHHLLWLCPQALLCFLPAELGKGYPWRIIPHPSQNRWVVNAVSCSSELPQGISRVPSTQRGPCRGWQGWFSLLLHFPVWLCGLLLERPSCSRELMGSHCQNRTGFAAQTIPQTVTAVQCSAAEWDCFESYWKKKPDFLVNYPCNRTLSIIWHLEVIEILLSCVLGLDWLLQDMRGKKN